MKVLDASGCIMGRLASHAAKSLLNGDEIHIINAEEAVISGNKDSVLDEIFIRFEKSILSKEINEMGAVDGDTIVLGNLEFEYKQ